MPNLRVKASGSDRDPHPPCRDFNTTCTTAAFNSSGHCVQSAEAPVWVAICWMVSAGSWASMASASTSCALSPAANCQLPTANCQLQVRLPLRLIRLLRFPKRFEDAVPLLPFSAAEPPTRGLLGDEGFEAGHEFPPAFRADVAAGGLEGFQAGIDLAAQHRQVRLPAAIAMFLNQRPGFIPILPSLLNLRTFPPSHFPTLALACDQSQPRPQQRHLASEQRHWPPPRPRLRFMQRRLNLASRFPIADPRRDRARGNEACRQ